MRYLAIGIMLFSIGCGREATTPEQTRRVLAYPLSAASDEVDVGVIAAGGKMQFVTKLTNHSAERIAIARITTSCSCLSGSSSIDEMLPFGNAYLKLSLDMTGTPCFTGDTKIRVQIFDSNNEIAGEFTVRAYVVEPRELDEGLRSLCPSSRESDCKPVNGSK